MRFSEGEGTPSNEDYFEAAYGLTIVNLGMEDKVLDYHDTLLRVRDVCLLTGPNWLNDAILGFYFSFLQKDKYASLRRSVSFVDASVSFLVANVAEGDVAGILDPLGLQNTEISLFPVSNNEDVEVPEGGSHWSLLVFRKGERGGMDTFEHYDSAGAVNERAASGLVAAVTPHLCNSRRHKFTSSPAATPRQDNGHDCGLYVLAVADAAVTPHLCNSRRHKFTSSPAATPRQDNGHDCGLYVLAVADAVCSAHELSQSGNVDEESTLTRKLGKITPEFIADFRLELLDLVEELSSGMDTGTATTLDTASSLEHCEYIA